MIGMDDGVSDAESGYPCCDCCDHLEENYDAAIWRHDEPCPNGCDGDD